VFTGIGGTVTLATPITVHGVTFPVAGFTISASAGTNVLNFGAGGLIVDAQAGTNTISALYTPVLGTITKNGEGVFVSGTGQNAFAGKWVINAGILSISGDARLGVAPATMQPDLLTLNGGFLQSSLASITYNSLRGITL